MKKLNRETKIALEIIRRTGLKQSILSALRQDLLTADTKEFGVDGYFEMICGSDNLNGASKMAGAKELMKTLEGQGVKRGEIVLIGDSLHDKEVSEALGIGCVLCAQGGHSLRRLLEVAPTGETLLDALVIALAGKAENMI